MAAEPRLLASLKNLDFCTSELNFYIPVRLLSLEGISLVL